MRELETAVEVKASPEELWTVLTDVTRWPEWTPSVQSVELLTGPVSGVGSLRFTGVLGTAMGLITRRLGYLQIEAAGLKARCERASPVEAPRAVKSAS